MRVIKKYSYRLVALSATVLGAALPFLANAQTTLNEPTNVITTPQEVMNLFCGALDWLFWGLIVLSIAMFLVGGYIYVTSGGDAEKVSKATKTLTYAAIGVVIALIAQGVPLLIQNILGASGNLNACAGANGVALGVLHAIRSSWMMRSFA